MPFQAIESQRMYQQIANQIARLPDNTLVYPGHDYLANNLAFTLDREPDNEEAASLLAQAKQQDPNRALVSNIGLERQINTFMRLDSPLELRFVSLR